MGTEGLTDEQYIQQLRETVEQQRQRIAELEARVMQAETQVSAHRTQARAEGFRAAKERAADLLVKKWDMLPGCLEVKSIRAMEDAGDGGEKCTCRPGHRSAKCPSLVGAPSFPCCGGSDEHPPEHTQDCPTRGEPPLSQLRAATERMEAAAQPGPAAMLGEAVELLARVVQLAQMGGAPGVLVSSCQLALHNMRVEKREADAREGQG